LVSRCDHQRFLNHFLVEECAVLGFQVLYPPLVVMIGKAGVAD
jgi:hypothetical protein